MPYRHAKVSSSPLYLIEFHHLRHTDLAVLCALTIHRIAVLPTRYVCSLVHYVVGS